MVCSPSPITEAGVRSAAQINLLPITSTLKSKPVIKRSQITLRPYTCAAASALKATEARDVDALLEAGGQIDEACEACHKKFWYPGAPTAPGTEPAAK